MEGKECIAASAEPSKAARWYCNAEEVVEKLVRNRYGERLTSLKFDLTGEEKECL